MDTHSAQTRLSRKCTSRAISGKEDYFHNFQYRYVKLIHLIDVTVLIISVNFPFAFKCLSFSMLKMWQALPGVMLITYILYVFQILFRNTCHFGCVYEVLYQKLCKKFLNKSGVLWGFFCDTF